MSTQEAPPDGQAAEGSMTSQQDSLRGIHVEPLLDDRTLTTVARRLCLDWVKLAVELSFTIVGVQTIETKYKNDVIRQGLDMLVTWKNAQSTRVEDQVTTLCTALKKIERADIAAFLQDVPAEIRNRAAYQKALEKGSATVHRSLINESFNSKELSTEGVTTDCTINISSAQSWNCKRADRQPMSDIHFREIAKDLGKEWEQLATYLGIKPEEVDKIKIDYNASGVNEQIFQMLVQWRQKRGNEVDKMRKELIDALIEVKKPGLADEVQKY